MKKHKILATVIKENSGYSAFTTVQKHFIASEGENFEDLKENLLNAVNLALKGNEYTYQIKDVKIQFDLESFFDFYKVINAKALSERIGMNQSLMAQYIKGIKKPSAVQTRRILQGVQQVGKELLEVRFLL
jgi:hypothetical protein